MHLQAVSCSQIRGRPHSQETECDEHNPDFPSIGPRGDNRREVLASHAIMRVMNDHTSRPVATRDDSDFSLSIDEALERYSKAGHPRTPRSVQRYCAKGHLQCRLVETGFGEKYLIEPESVDKHIAYIEEVTPATGRDKSGQDATSRTLEINNAEPQREVPTLPNLSRQDATSPDTSRYVAQLEKENEFMREQIGVKDTQIKELTERARETNMLVAGLQKLLAPLLSTPPSATDRG